MLTFWNVVDDLNANEIFVTVNDVDNAVVDLSDIVSIVVGLNDVVIKEDDVVYLNERKL